MDLYECPAEAPRELEKWFFAAMKTKPADLTAWWNLYWKAMKRGRRPPTKLRIESDTERGHLTIGAIELIKCALEIEDEFSSELLDAAWAAAGLTRAMKRALLERIKSKNFELDTDCFVAACICAIVHSVREALDMVCQLYALDAGALKPRSAYKVKCEDFRKMYSLVAEMFDETELAQVRLGVTQVQRHTRVLRRH